MPLVLNCDRSTVKHALHNTQNDCYQWLSNSPRVHQIPFRPGLCPGPRWGSLRRSPRPLSWIYRGLLLRGGEGKGRERREEVRGEWKGRGRDARERGGEGRIKKRRGGKKSKNTPSVNSCLRPWHFYSCERSATVFRSRFGTPYSSVSSTHVPIVIYRQRQVLHYGPAQRAATPDGATSHGSTGFGGGSFGGHLGGGGIASSDTSSLTGFAILYITTLRLAIIAFPRSWSLVSLSMLYVNCNVVNNCHNFTMLLSYFTRC